MKEDLTKARVDSLNPRKPLYLDKTAKVTEAVILMEKNQTGCVLIKDREALVGILTERDILRNLTSMHLEFGKTPVTQLMSTDPNYLYQDDSAAYALNEMSFGGFRNITVLSDVGDPSGVLTVEDILDHIIDIMHLKLEKTGSDYVPKTFAEKNEIGVEDFDRPMGVLDPPTALSVESGSCLKDAVQKMANHNIGCVTVVRDKKLVGILTERFLLYKIAHKTPDYEKAIVDDFMRPNPVCLQMRDPIKEAVRILRKHEVRHIAIVNEMHEPIAFTSVRGIIDYIVSFFPEEIINLPPHPSRFGIVDEAGA